MKAESGFRTLGLVLGVILIVSGVGLANMGYNQMQAADEWDSQTHYCGSATFPYETVDCPENPYKGGELILGIGIVLLLFGGFSARWGTQ